MPRSEQKPPLSHRPGCVARPGAHRMHSSAGCASGRLISGVGSGPEGAGAHAISLEISRLDDAVGGPVTSRRKAPPKERPGPKAGGDHCMSPRSRRAGEGRVRGAFAPSLAFHFHSRFFFPASAAGQWAVRSKLVGRCCPTGVASSQPQRSRLATQPACRAAETEAAKRGRRGRVRRLV